jgi:hypothetical protein
MKSLFYISLTLGLLLAGCGDKSDKPASATTNAASQGSTPASAPADYLGALGKGQQSAIKVTDVSSLDKAIQMFNVEQGRYPKDLNELVEQKYLPRIPAAPYGTKLEYDAKAGKVRVVKP